MPIEYRIDHDKRLVFAKAQGPLSMADLFNYQNEVWSLPEVVGYSELIDLTAAIITGEATAEMIKDLASLEAEMDTVMHSPKLAIAASEDFIYGLGRMYEAFRELQAPSGKEIDVFRTVEEALQWLGFEDIGELPR